MRAAVAIALALAALAALAPAQAAEGPQRTALDCAYSPRGVGDVVPFKACATANSGGEIRLTPQHLRRLRFDRYGLASLWLGAGFYYVSRAGRPAPVMATDNWADDFSDGLARSPRGAKVGFIDRSLRLAISARYDGALPFQRGRAAVCIGCTLAPVRPGAEVKAYAGGKWGCIDVRGREVVALEGRSIDTVGC